MKPKVSVIIPTKNEEDNITLCLKSLKSQNYSPIEIIVIDNYSTDKTVQMARALGAKVLQIGPERSAQRNFGAKKATGEILFFVDADMEVRKGVVCQAVDLFEKDSSIKGVIVPEESQGETFWARVRALERNCYLGESMVEAARIFEKKAFLKLGGFDENLVAAEDWDLTHRAAKVGKIGRTGDKILHHEGTLSLLTHLRKKYYYARGIKCYAQKHPEKFKNQSGLSRLHIFAKNWKKLAADPIHGVGVLILKLLEYLIFLSAKLK